MNVKGKVGEERTRALEKRGQTLRLWASIGLRALLARGPHDSSFYPFRMDLGPRRGHYLTCVGTPGTCCLNLLHLPPSASPWPLIPAHSTATAS